MGNVQQAIEHIFPLVYEFRKERNAEEVARMQARALQRSGVASSNNAISHKRQPVVAEDYESFDDEELEDEELLDYPDSDESWD